VKVGAMVFLCHDINDVFMEGAKMARYAEHRWLPTALFAVFMASWFGSRIYYFPAYVIRSVYYEPINVSPFSPLVGRGAPAVSEPDIPII
jgi:ceramide synthetase